MLSYQAIALPQAMQRLRGDTMLCPAGTRAMTTFRKLPTIAPKANTHSMNATGMALATRCI